VRVHPPARDRIPRTAHCNTHQPHPHHVATPSHACIERARRSCPHARAHTVSSPPPRHAHTAAMHVLRSGHHHSGLLGHEPRRVAGPRAAASVRSSQVVARPHHGKPRRTALRVQAHGHKPKVTVAVAVSALARASHAACALCAGGHPCMTGRREARSPAARSGGSGGSGGCRTSPCA
jgi:hypothetical protein